MQSHLRIRTHIYSSKRLSRAFGTQRLLSEGTIVWQEDCTLRLRIYVSCYMVNAFQNSEQICSQNWDCGESRSDYSVSIIGWSILQTHNDTRFLDTNTPAEIKMQFVFLAALAALYLPWWLHNLCWLSVIHGFEFSFTILTKQYLSIPIHSRPYQAITNQKLWPNFTIQTKFHNFDQISQFQPNSTILTKF